MPGVSLYQRLLSIKIKQQQKLPYSLDTMVRLLRKRRPPGVFTWAPNPISFRAIRYSWRPSPMKYAVPPNAPIWPPACVIICSKTGRTEVGETRLNLRVFYRRFCRNILPGSQPASRQPVDDQRHHRFFWKRYSFEKYLFRSREYISKKQGTHLCTWHFTSNIGKRLIT